MKRTLLAAAVLCFALSPAWAQPLERYVVLKGGFYDPQASDLDGFDKGLAVGVALGLYATPSMAIEFGVERYVTDFNEMGISIDGTIIPITVSLKGVHRTQSGSLFVGGGLGLYLAELDVAVVGLGSGSEDDTTFGFHLLAGGNFYIAPNIFLGGELKYFWVTPKFAGIDIDMDGFVATANLGFMF
jgi:opacity protein-like surface antigen